MSGEMEGLKGKEEDSRGESIIEVGGHGEMSLREDDEKEEEEKVKEGEE